MRKISNAAKILTLLAQNPGRSFTAKDFVEKLGVADCTASTQSGHLVRAGKIARVAPGRYQALDGAAVPDVPARPLTARQKRRDLDKEIKASIERAADVVRKEEPTLATWDRKRGVLVPTEAGKAAGLVDPPVAPAPVAPKGINPRAASGLKDLVLGTLRDGNIGTPSQLAALITRGGREVTTKQVTDSLTGLIKRGEVRRNEEGKFEHIGEVA
jgi:hypothetical protein